MYKKFTVFVFIILPLVLVGCETSRGFGKDVEGAGKSIQRTVDKND